MVDCLIGHDKQLAVGEEQWPSGLSGVVLQWNSPELPKQQVATAVARHVKRVRVLYGATWLTQEGDAGDAVLRPGQDQLPL
jgi:hypothetical protein